MIQFPILRYSPNREKWFAIKAIVDVSRRIGRHPIENNDQGRLSNCRRFETANSKARLRVEA